MKKPIIVIILFGIMLIFVMSLNSIKPTNPDKCIVDADCVPATCCHPTECVYSAQAPNCEGIMCTMSCETPLDCGGARCACQDGKCIVELTNEN